MKRILKSQTRRKNKNDKNYVPKKPITLEDKKEPDASLVVKQHEPEIEEEESIDEFSEYFNNRKNPKICFTTQLDSLHNKEPSYYTLRFIKDLMGMFPQSNYYKRRKYSIKDIQQYCIDRDFTDIIIIGQRLKKPNQLVHIHLPDGPTAYYRISNPIIMDKIKNHAKLSQGNPELILTNFSTRLGMRIKRMLNALVPHEPNLQARKVVTFHNQRDFIFVRHYRYLFSNLNRVTVEEIGPSFTLRLEKLQIGLYDSKFGEYEWYGKKEIETSRRRLFL